MTAGLGAISGRALDVGMVATAFVFGLRHGLDWDHLAALGDLAQVPDAPRRSMLLASCYAAGHAAVVFVLGVAAIVFAERLPDGVDQAMERVVGATLVLLGVVVLVSLARHGSRFRMRSRWMIVITGARRLATALRARFGRPPLQEFVVVEHDHPHRHDRGHDHGHAHACAPVGHQAQAGSAADGLPHGEADAAGEHRHHHRHVLPVPHDPFASPGVGTAVGIGALHGVGAETPTQVVVFAGAAGASGPVAGVCVLASFLVGLLVANTAVAAAVTFGGSNRARRFPVYATLSVVTAVFSLAVGALFLAGQAHQLPSILGG